MKRKTTLRLIIIVSVLLSGRALMNANAAVITDQLIASYPFNSNAEDESGNGHDGTVNGAQLTADRFGTPDSAYLFDGTDDYIEVLDAPALRLNNTDFTISSWFFETSRNASYHNALITKRGLGSDNGWFYSVSGEAAGTGAGKLIYQVSAGADPLAAAQSPVSLNMWHHAAMTYDSVGGTVKFYIDGSLESVHAGMPTPNASASAGMFIGLDSALGGYAFHGAIDDISIYDRALSAAEVSTLYEAVPEPSSIAMIVLVSGCAMFVRSVFI